MSYCKRCGRCCWDFKTSDSTAKCDQLADDLKTCLIHDDPTRQERYGCVKFPDVHHVVDLPEDCGFMEYWRKEGLV